MKNVITLHGQSFLDDNGDRYIYWGTWGIFNDDMKSFSDKGIILNTQATDFFEGPFMLKHNDKYCFTYSSASRHEGTYCVQYAIAQQDLLFFQTIIHCSVPMKLTSSLRNLVFLFLNS